MEQQVEILQASSLEDYDWPEKDPHSVPQRTRQATSSDLDLVRQCLKSAEINLDAFLKETRRRKLSDAETVMALLAHQKFQMNPSGLVKQEPQWIRCVEAAINSCSPVDIVYPQFCVIPNAPKRYTNVGCAAGEDCTIEFLKLINRHVQAIHPPGVRFHVLADAALYGSAFQTHQTEIDAYYDSLENRIRTLNASDCVLLYDYSELLRTKCHPDYQTKYYAIGHEVWAGDPSRLLPNSDVPTLRRSVKCSVNTRRFQLRHIDHLQLFGPAKWRNPERPHPYQAIVDTLTDIAFHEVITIRLACGAVDISSRLWPGALRATCHKGPKNDRWAIGLKPYPEYYGSCKLLPYHGMPLITRDGRGHPKLVIVPEVLLRCREDLVRVTSDGKDEVYAYVAGDIEGEIAGTATYTRPFGMRFGEEYRHAEET